MDLGGKYFKKRRSLGSGTFGEVFEGKRYRDGKTGF